MRDKVATGKWIAFALAFLSPAALGAFAGGTGQPNDPYQIATAEQLLSIGSDPKLLAKCYILVSDIDLDPNLPGGRVFSGAVIAPDGSDMSAGYQGRGLMGRFDGQGHKIRRLNLQGESYLGLFGMVAPSGTVCRLGLEEIAISARNDYCGALTGTNYGIIRDCWVTKSVIRGSTGTSHLGGLVGWNSGTISFCSCTSDVLGTWDFTGGLVGYNEGSISYSYSTGNVTGRIPVGGVAGWHGGTLLCVYSSGSVAGERWVGGLVGFLNPHGVLYSSYSASHVTGTRSDVGGLVGIGSSGTVQDCYFLAAAYGGGPDNRIGTALTADQMRQRDSFVGWDFSGVKSDGVADPWFMPPESYPVLTWQTEVTGLRPIPPVGGLSADQAKTALLEAGFVVGEVRYDFYHHVPSGLGAHTRPDSFAPPGSVVDVFLSLGPYDWGTNPGDGTAAKPYEIQTAGELEALSDHLELWNKNFVLMADVDMTGRTYSTALIAPDASESQDGFQGTGFTGSFNGAAHRIANLSILGQGRDYLGLFGMVGVGGRVQGLLLDDAIITGDTGSIYVGTLAGANAGTIMSCSATGTVVGCTRIDGLVGSNSGTVADCHIDVTVRKLCPGMR